MARTEGHLQEAYDQSYPAYLLGDRGFRTEVDVRGRHAGCYT
jgi:hypothetical protein